MKKYVYSAACTFYCILALSHTKTTTTYESSSSRAIRLRQKNLVVSYCNAKEQTTETILSDVVNVTIEIQEQKTNEAEILKQKIAKPAPVIEQEIVRHPLDTKEHIIQAPTNHQNPILQPVSIQSTQTTPVITQATEKKVATFKNNIDAAMTTYHHWSGSYTPEFSITINGKTLLKEETIECPCDTSEPLVITYHAKFPYGYSSTDQILFLPNKFPCIATITFAWDKNPRIVITQE